jgi:hypothetical protein
MKPSTKPKSPPSKRPVKLSSSLPWPDIAPPDVCFSLKKRRLVRLKYWLVTFHNGIRSIGPFLVVAHNRSQARNLAQSCVPEALYGPNVVFLKAEASLEMPIQLDAEAYQLIAEKAGVHL